jgi:hypothetical protein
MKDAKTKKPIELGTLAKANAERWKAIEGSKLEMWKATIVACIDTFAGLDDVWTNNRETLIKQFTGERAKSKFAKYYSGYTGSISNMNHFITIARGKKDADGKYTGKMFTATDVVRYNNAIQKANEAGKVLKYSRLCNLSAWFHAGGNVDALTKEDAKRKPAGEASEGEDPKKHGASRVSISVNGSGSIKETTEGELTKSLPKDGSTLTLCSDAFSVLFKAMEREERDAFEQFKAQVVAKCGPLVAEVVE